MRRWVFVRDLIEGLPYPVLDTLLGLRKAAADTPVVSADFGPPGFQALVKELAEAELVRLLGPLPSAGEAQRPDYKILTIPGVNFVKLGIHNYEKNGKFSFELDDAPVVWFSTLHAVRNKSRLYRA